MRVKKIHQAVLTASIVGSTVASSIQAAPVTWNGGGLTPWNWNDGANWVGGVAPVATDSLIFDGTVNAVNVNNFVAGTQFNGITWTNTWASAATPTQTGNSINLAGDLVSNRVSGTIIPTLNTPLVLTQNVNTTVVSGGTLAVGGIVSGGFSVTNNGGGITALNALNTFTGGLNLTAGTTRGGSSGNTNASLGTGTISISNGAVLETRSTGSVTFNNALSLGTGGGAIYDRSNHTFSPASITGTGPLTLGPTGADNLLWTVTDLKGWAGQLNTTKNGRLNFALRLATAYVNNSAINVAFDLGDATSITRQSGTNQTSAVTDIGSLSSAFANTSFGNTGTAGTGYVTYSIGSLNTSTTFAGNIVSGSAVRKVGTGNLTLAGATNTYVGPTTVSAGTLTLANGATINGTSSVTVNANAILVNNGTITTAGAFLVNGTLGGNGSVSAPTTTINGALTPGNSVGKLTWTSGNLALGDGIAAGATSTFEIASTGTPGVGYDNVTLNTGSIVYDGTLNLTFASAPTVPGTYDLFTFNTGLFSGQLDGINIAGTTGSMSLVSGNWSGLINGLSADFNLGTGDLVLSLSAVPEPLTAAGVILLAGRVLGRRSRVSM